MNFAKFLRTNFLTEHLWVAVSAEVYSGLCQNFKIELFAKIVNDWNSLTIFRKASSEMLDRALNTPLLITR